MAEATRVIAIRHGETAWNVDARIQGHLDVGLNDTGRKQARRLAQALADEAIAAIYSSDLSRARETAQAVAARHPTVVTSERALRERGFGVFEGLTFTQVEQRWPDAALRWRQRDPSFGPEAGETLRDFYERVVANATRIAARHTGQTIVLVSHGGVLDCLYRAATRQALDAPRTWQLGNASINRLLYSESGFALVGWADTMHLEATLSAADDASEPAEAVSLRGASWR